MEKRPYLLESKTIENAVDLRKVYNDGGELDGCALEIHVRNGGKSKRAYFRYNGSPFGEKRVERVPLGRYERGLAELRRKRDDCEQLVKQGKSPKIYLKRKGEQRLERQRLARRTLGDALDEFFSFAPGRFWKSAYTRTLNTGIKTHYFDGSDLVKLPLNEVKPYDVFKLISPFWYGKYVVPLHRESRCRWPRPRRQNAQPVAQHIRARVQPRAV